MGFASTNMGLRIWDLPTDDFDGSELANNFTTIDRHDHSEGRGRRIPTGGIVDAAITNVKVADNAISTSKLLDGSITASKLSADIVDTQHIVAAAVTAAKVANAAITTAKVADGTITEQKVLDSAITGPKLATGSVSTTKVQDAAVTEPKLGTNAVSTRTIIDRNVTEPKLATPAVSSVNIFPGAVTSDKLAPDIIPVGTVISWYRPSDLTPVPTGWVVPIGQTLADADHDFTEGASITLPDLRNRFILGAAESGTGADTASPPPIGQAGGSNSASVPSHVHTIPAHSHSVNSHGHSVNPDTHRHFYKDDLGANQDTRQRGAAVYGNLSYARREALYVPGLNYLESQGEDVPAPMGMYTHSHGGLTGNAAPGTTSVALTTDSVASTSLDNRPRYVGLLFLMKVKA